jgi:hypothetical protein
MKTYLRRALTGPVVIALSAGISCVATGAFAQVQVAPNGTYVGGQPHIAPNGTYVGGQPYIAPNGTYVGGQPQIAPNGTYLGGQGR